MLSLFRSLAMNKLIRILVAVAVIPAFIFMAGTMCCSSQAQASSLPVRESQPVLKAAPHSCCPNGDRCPSKSVFISKDEAVQSQDIQIIKTELKTTLLQVEVPVLFQKVSFYSSNWLALSPPDPVQLSTIQLLI